MLLTSTVLRVRSHREQDRLYTVYTKERGKLTVLGVGHEKITSKLAGHLGPFVISELTVVPARIWEKLIAAEVLEVFPRLPSALPRVGVAWYLLELVDLLTKENHPDRALWELLVEGLRALDAGADAKTTLRTFPDKLLSILGIRPPLAEHLAQEVHSAAWLARVSA